MQLDSLPPRIILAGLGTIETNSMIDKRREKSSKSTFGLKIENGSSRALYIEKEREAKSSRHA